MTDNFHRPSGPLDPVAAQVCDFLGADPTWSGMPTRPAHETRAALKAAADAMPIERIPVAHVEDLSAPAGDFEVPLRLYRPVEAPRAIIAYIHGGGFTLGDIDGTDNYCRLLANKSGCAVVSIDYRLAPEHRFPVAVEDSLAAVRWIAANRARLAGGAVPLLVGGDSAGGNLSAVVARRLAEAGESLLAGQILIYPCTDDADIPSVHAFPAPFLTQDQIVWFFDQYDPERTARDHPDFSPIKADNLAGLPPAIVITAEHDLLTEQAEAYANKLAAAGVPVTVRRYPGMIHGFATMDLFFAGAAGEAVDEVVTFVDGIVPGR